LGTADTVRAPSWKVWAPPISTTVTPLSTGACLPTMVALTSTPGCSDFMRSSTIRRVPGGP